MSARRTTSTAHRVMTQVRHDRRTMALLLVMPLIIMSILAWILPEPAFDRFGPPLLGIFPLIIMFLVTSVATLRERTSGTLERLLSMPMARGDLIGGYAIAFGILGIVQSVIVAGFCYWALGLTVLSSPLFLTLVAVAQALLGTAMGLFLSAFARTEFQAVQFFPAILIPQLLLCGLLVPVDQLPTAAQWVAHAVPLTYAMDAVTGVTTLSSPGAGFWWDICVVAGFIVGFLVAGTATLRRRTA